MILLSNLAFDCADASRVASFWRQALRYDAPEPTPEELAVALVEHPEWEGLAVVDEDSHRHPRLYLQTVPEPKAGVNRVRPVVACDDIERLVVLGATIVDGDRLRDVEGNEFRVVPASLEGPRFESVEIDALDPLAQAAFWAEALGFILDETACHPPTAWRERVSWFPSFVFVEAEDPKQRKNRIHFDLMCRPEEGDHERLLSLGATDVQYGDGFVTMQDREGNEFDLTV